MKEADRIRDYALERFIDPARKSNKRIINFCARDIHDGLRYSLEDHRFPNIIQAIEGKKFRDLARIRSIEKLKPPTAPSGQSSTICWEIFLK